MTRPVPSAVVFAKAVAVHSRFYAQVIGLAELYKEEGHVVLGEGSFQLVIHGIPEKIATSIKLTQPPRVREDAPIKICLPVESIELARTRAAALGGMIGAKGKQWQARGFIACDGFDPDGNVFQVRESAGGVGT